MRRRDGGRPVKEAMKRADVSIPGLAKATKELDPFGDGVSKSLVGAVVSSGSSGRESFRRRSAQLIATALDLPISELFDEESTHAEGNHIHR